MFPKINSTDLFYSFDWILKITPPDDIQNDYSIARLDSIEDSIFISATSIPSTNTELIVNNYFNGINTYMSKLDWDIDNFNISVLNDSLLLNYSFFEKWNKLRISNKNNKKSNRVILLNYPDTYMGSMEIQLKYNKTQEIIYKVQYKDVFPNNIGDVTLNTEEVDISRFDVSLTFSDVIKKSYLDDDF